MTPRGPSCFAWRWYFQPSWSQATVFCGAIGLFLLALAGREVMKKRDQLASWPTVIAHVDSATIVTPQPRREAVYAARYWLSFSWGGTANPTVTTLSAYSCGYGSHWSRTE